MTDKNYPRASLVRNKTVHEIATCYVGNLIASVILRKLGSKRSIQITTDKAGDGLTGIVEGISPVNFWGLVLRKPYNKDLAVYISKSEIAALKELNGRILEDTYKLIHKTYSNNPLAVKYDDLYDSIRILSRRLKVQPMAVADILNGIRDFDELSTDHRHDLLVDVLNMLTADRESPYIPLIRKEISKTVRENKRGLTEDDGGASVGDAVITSGDVAGYPSVIGAKPMRRKVISVVRIKRKKETPKN